MTKVTRVAVLTATLMALVTPFAAAQERANRPPDTDKTVPVTRGSRMTINNNAGEVVIHTWDRDQLRVQARHGSRTTIDIQNTAGAVTLRARSTGAPSGVDYDITAPAWMPVK